MTPERWQQIDQIFHAALELAPDERAAFIDASCLDDKDLRRQIQILLAAHEQSDSFIETPAADVAAALMAEEAAGFTPGQAVGPYTINNLLGVGGMGQVYLATDTRLGRKVALKILPRQFTIDPDRIKRFEKEARAASALNHPNIVTIHEVGSFNDTRFIVTEFVDGHTLREMIDEKPLTLSETLNVTIQVAGALRAAHAAGIVHRDIKPENIMLRADGYVKILDFGLAKLTESSSTDSQLEGSTLLQSSPGLVMGTVQYMSPEQARGAKTDARTDIWSLGVVLYELLSGRAPFSGETPSHVMVSVMEHEPSSLTESAGLPAELNDIVSKALRKKKKERYQTADELIRDLKEFKQEVQIQSRLKEPADNLQFQARTKFAGDKQTRRLDAPVTGRTMAVEFPHPTSSAEYLVTRIKQHKLAFVIVTLILVSSTIAFVAYLAHVAAAGETIDSVAVLPFINVTTDPNTEYLSDGLSDSIIDSLSRLPNLKKVSAFNSVLRYKGRQVDPQTVGKDLGVRAVLIGRLTQHGDDVLISAELVDVKDNKRLWGGQYDRKLADVPKLQSEIAQEITDRLRLKLTDTEKQRLTSGTDDPEAYQLYMKGRYFRQNKGSVKARDYLEQAIKKDPNFARAYAQLGYLYAVQQFAGGPSAKEVRDREASVVQRALEIDDMLGDAHAVSALMRADVQDWHASIREFQRALELDPNSADVHRFYSAILWSLGRFDEALVHIRRAQELDPVSPAMYLDMCRLLSSARQYGQALEQCGKTLELNPNYYPAHTFLAVIYLAEGQNEKAIAEAEKANVSGDDPTSLAQLGQVYAFSGRSDDALKMLDQLKQLSQKRYVAPDQYARIYAGLGDKDKAFEFLEKQYQEFPTNLNNLKVVLWWDSLRSDPRYLDLLRRMKLSE